MIKFMDSLWIVGPLLALGALVTGAMEHWWPCGIFAGLCILTAAVWFGLGYVNLQSLQAED